MYIFSQPLFESITERRGRFFYQKQAGSSLLRVNFVSIKEDDNPRQTIRDEYVFDGRWLSHIDYKTRQVKKYEQAEEGKSIDAFELISRSFPIIGFDKVDEYENLFEIQLAEPNSTDAGRLIQLNLKPKPGTAYAKDYVSIELWLDTQTDLPAKVVAVNTEQERYIVEFIKPVINKRIDESIFKFKIPDGFEVETERLRKERFS